MTVWLKRGEKWLDIVYDAALSEPIPERGCTFYLMSKIGREGIFKQNNMWVPLKDGVKERKRGGPQIVAEPAQLGENWAAVADGLTGHVLAVFFDIPALKKATFMDNDTFNYELFTLDSAKSPGVIRFRLCGDQGGVEKVEAWKAAWTARAP